MSTYVQLATADGVSQGFVCPQKRLCSRQQNMEQYSCTPYVRRFAMRSIQSHFRANIEAISQSTCTKLILELIL
jgi:hypothetical protein